MEHGVEVQKAVYENSYSVEDSRWSFHYTADPLTRYLRDRRLSTALRTLDRHLELDRTCGSALVVCGGVGGEGTFLRKAGFQDVTVSDFSSEALERCGRFDPALKTLLLDAEDMALCDSSYDIVLVQDGLHHLPRPVLGFTEMLRVARKAVVVIEPYRSLVGRLAGTEWEVQGSAINYVFRWNRTFLEQCTRSYLLSRDAKVVAVRMWDHGSMVAKAVKRIPPRGRHVAAVALYRALSLVWFSGNMMVGVVVKSPAEFPPERLLGH
jgi:ubiquinone/menaquinone biosynthesis C-methylase UbiE